MELDKDTILLLTLQNYLDITEKETTDIIKSLDQINLNDTDDTLQSLFEETLSNFDQILKVTSIKLWKHQTATKRQETAANNLKHKMKNLEIISATASTAASIERATKNIKYQQGQDTSTLLRVTNLDKYTKNKRTFQQNEI